MWFSAITFYQSFVTCLSFLRKKGVDFCSPTPNIIEPINIGVSSRKKIEHKRKPTE
jgi:hypothetical protein